MYSQLELRTLIRAGVENPNSTSKSGRHFLDFVVDGQSLWETLGKRHDMVSVLCVEYAKDETVKAASRLLLNEKADLPNGRRSFFVCSECGDLGCGAITAVVERQGETFTWKAFGYENTYEDEVALDAYDTVGPFTFDAAKYESTLRQAMDLLRCARS
jgi:hypothetical protein